MYDIYILIIQAMQLPMVFLIIIFSFNNRLLKPAGRQHGFGTEALRNFLLNTPLRYIAIGLICNVFYLGFNILANSHFSEPTIPSDSYRLAIIFFDLFTAYFFLLEAVGWVITDNGIVFIGFSPEKYGIPPKRIRIVIGLLLLAITSIIFITNIKQYNLLFYVFDFVSYLVIAICLYYKFNLKGAKNIYGNKFLFAGFLTWSLLQLLAPLGKYLGLTEEQIPVMGFSGSFLSKGFILFGLYNYAVQIASDAYDLSEQKNSQLNEKIGLLGELQEMVNIVSNTKNSIQLGGTIIKQFTDKGIFNYDYAVFTIMDDLALNVTKVHTRGGPEFKGKRLIHLPPDESPVTIDMAWKKAVDTGRIVYVLNEVLKISIDAPDAGSNDESGIRINGGFHGLQSLIIPILKIESAPSVTTSKHKHIYKKVLGILEVGMASDPERQRVGIDKNAGELGIYLDNCSQMIEKLQVQEMELAIQQALQHCDIASSDDHMEYLRILNGKITSLFNASYGVVYLLKDGIIDPDPRWIYGSGISEQNRMLIQKRMQQFHNDQKTSKGRKVDLETFIGQLSVSLNCDIAYISQPIIFSEYWQCVFLFYSPIKIFSPDDFQYFMNKMSGEIMLNFNEKKFHYCISESIMPTNRIIEPESIFLPVMKILQDYFSVSVVKIWLKDPSYTTSSGVYYSERYRSPDSSQKLKGYENRIPYEMINFRDEFILYDLSSQDRDTVPLESMNFTDHTEMAAVVQKALKTDFQDYGFINLYFRATVKSISREDINFLSIIATKLVLNLQLHSVVLAFKEISSSFVLNDFNGTLKIITDKALELLNADPVILFKSRDGENVFFRDVTYSNVADFEDQKIIEVFNSKSDNHVELAELVIQHGTCYFNNYQDYENYEKGAVRKHERAHFDTSFWKREGIKAMAAIRLDNNIGRKSRSVGVMFINFRSQVKFNDEMKRLIETFAALASGSISNGLIFERNYQYLNRNLKMSQPLLLELIAHGALHNAHKTFKVVNLMYYNMINDWDSPGYKRKNPSVFDIRGDVKKLELPIAELYDHFEDLQKLYKPNDNLELADYDIVKLINEQLFQLENDFNSKFISVKFSTVFDALLIECDGKVIGNSIFNILFNAYQALGNRGNIEVKLSENGNDKIDIEIIDDGKGISKDIFPMILEPYITDKVDGSGLGLAMSRVSIEKHGGKLRYHSRPKRTEFIITLPKKIKNG